MNPTDHLQPLPPLTPITGVEPAAVEIIMAEVVKRYGDAINQMQFHAWDEHQQPTGDAMSAQQYAHWLLETNTHRSTPELQQLSQQYDAAFTAHHNRDDIANLVTREQVAEFLIAAEVFRYQAAILVPTTAPVQAIAPMPIPSMPPVAVPTPAPVPAPTPHPTTAAPALSNTGIESPAELQTIKQELLQFFSLPATQPITAAVLAQQEQTMLSQQQTVLHSQNLTEEQLNNALSDYQKTVHLKALQLQSVEARLRPTA